MPDSFKRKHPGYRGDGQRSKGGQCRCCTEVKGKQSQNRLARARMTVETREMAEDGEAVIRDEQAEEAARWCTDPHPVSFHNCRPDRGYFHR